jgi:hypothetical protein
VLIDERCCSVRVVENSGAKKSLLAVIPGLQHFQECKGGGPGNERQARYCFYAGHKADRTLGNDIAEAERCENAGGVIDEPGFGAGGNLLTYCRQ